MAMAISRQNAALAVSDRCIQWPAFIKRGFFLSKELLYLWFLESSMSGYIYVSLHSAIEMEVTAGTAGLKRNHLGNS